MLLNLFNKLGADPHKSWSNFKLGLVLFVIGVVLILVGAQSWVYLQIPGVIVLASGFIIAIKGWLGLLANRFAQTLNQMSAAAHKNSKNTHLK